MAAVLVRVPLGAHPQGSAVQHPERRSQHAFPGEAVAAQVHGDSRRAAGSDLGQLEGPVELQPVLPLAPLRVVDVLPPADGVQARGLDVPAAAMEAANGRPNNSTITWLVAGGRSIEECNGGARFQPPDDFHKGKGIFANHQRVDIPARARSLPHLRETIARFRQGDHLQIHAALGEQRPAKLPVAQMRA